MLISHFLHACVSAYPPDHADGAHQALYRQGVGSGRSVRYFTACSGKARGTMSSI
ncbi:hypothetical protein [Pseudomonas agarici]|uniref:hypothetical protein n=1 Tax=Pseudomonas agarici TaxID=46677 RepID=UPI002108793C|nr:hypothetical protein [Pseudomonas agarici]